ncbi:hypothetical protein [Nocardia uniformis]|uniref:hypothetical protein n=1 Tax=Nocardia uniformis TaxID=53432 RepID=UPI0012F73CE5|nr:hypothetical protein [Nocardia uniformis]
MPPTSAYGWGSGVIDQLSSPPTANTYIDPDTAPEVIVTYQQLDWAIIAVACVAVLILSVMVMVLVSNAEFDDGPPATSPTSDTCQPFCAGVF